MHIDDLQKRITYLEEQIRADDFVSDYDRARITKLLRLNRAEMKKHRLASIDFEMKFTSDETEKEQCARERDRLLD